MGGIILGVVPNAYVVLLVASLVYATGSTVTRVVLVEVGPATLALARHRRARADAAGPCPPSRGGAARRRSS
jgi:hypothetical protein